VIFAGQCSHLPVVFWPQLGVLHRVRFQVLLQSGVDQHLHAGQRQLILHLLILVGAALLGLLGRELHADVLVEQLRLLFRRDLAAALAAHVRDIELELGFEQRFAVDCRDPLGGCGRGRRRRFVAGSEQHERGEQAEHGRFPIQAVGHLRAVPCWR
jgi:hypothetical protein